MRCPHCGFETHAGRTTCPECGERLIAPRKADQRRRGRGRDAGASEYDPYADSNPYEGLDGASRKRNASAGGSGLPGLIAVIAVALLLLIGGTLLANHFLHFFGGQPAKEVAVVATATPTPMPTRAPTAVPTQAPTAAPTNTPIPTAAPTNTPRPTEAPGIDSTAPRGDIHTRQDLIDVIWWMIDNGVSDLTTDGEILLPDAETSAICETFCGYHASYLWSNNTYSGQYTLSFEYRAGVAAWNALQNGTLSSERPEVQAVAAQAQDVVGRITSPGMSDLDKEKAIHDYIVDHCAYLIDVEGQQTADARGFFQYGKCQCVGYTDTFYLMARLAGLDVAIMSGYTDDDTEGDGHSWNLVRLDGSWYTLDVTWDDDDNPAYVNYYFFNLPDSYYGPSRTWDADCCPPGSYARTLDDNYYYHDIAVVAGSASEAYDKAVSVLSARGEVVIIDTSGAIDKSALGDRFNRQFNAGWEYSCTDHKGLSFSHFALN